MIRLESRKSDGIAEGLEMLLEDWEVWACAQQLLKQHGAKAPVHVATRIGRLVAMGDMAGVETWQAIAGRVDQLMDYRAGQPLLHQ